MEENQGNLPEFDPVLVERFAEGKGTVFVGPGVAMHAGLPSWAALMEPLRDELGAGMPASTSHLDVADMYQAMHGRAALVQHLKTRLGDARSQPGRVHELIVGLPVQRIYTTNLDTLLEQAAQRKQIDRKVNYSPVPADAGDTSTLSIVKLLGDLAAPDSLVIGAGDYYAYFARHPAIAGLLDVELQTHTALFLGYAFGDPDLGMILGRTAAAPGTTRPSMYALLQGPSEPAVRALAMRGIKAIEAPARPGAAQANDGLERWLDGFLAALRDHARKQAQASAVEGQAGGPRQQFGRTIAPSQIDNPDKRRQWGLPSLDQPSLPGFYIVELNVGYAGGLSAAEHEFQRRFRAAMAQDGADAGQAEEPLRISKSYFRCCMTDAQWQRLVKNDELRPDIDRVIYKLWPDFPVKSQTDRSVGTVKADAAMRAFNAAGAGIVWAVIDSGVDAAHPHFGNPDQPARHLLLHPDVVDLHRCFANIRLEDGQVVRATAPPGSPDENIDQDRRALLEQHRKLALSDEYGHGTHVAGIITGQAPAQGLQALERQYTLDPDGNKLKESYGVRSVDAEHTPRGVAPLCKIISLRILDDDGEGRASQVISALEYIREKINDNPKLMRVHGVNLSVGYEFDAEMFAAGQSPLCTEVDRLVQSGVVVVAAAGNTGYGTVAASAGASNIGLASSINDPGNAAGAITVGSTHRDSPHTYGISYFSSKGPTGDGRLKPDLVAPGERITSCATGKKLGKAVAQLRGDKGELRAYYVDDSGTSMAAPHVSGAIAAFLSVRREFIGKPLAVKQIMTDSATDLHRERYFQGNGLIDLMRALQSV